jgi:ATP phosphoribosyltransferase
MNKLTIALQKSGRLHEDSVKLLKECGIDISNGLNKLKIEAENFPLEVFFFRDDDIPQYVERRRCRHWDCRRKCTGGKAK